MVSRKEADFLNFHFENAPSHISHDETEVPDLSVEQINELANELAKSWINGNHKHVLSEITKYFNYRHAWGMYLLVSIYEQLPGADQRTMKKMFVNRF
ncbi:MAG TPA: hypothetical protein VK203_19640 [Nostocaceae cyanobacterium]|nr:hypothetical protein [Nostocaceae cyanobacterium]